MTKIIVNDFFAWNNKHNIVPVSMSLILQNEAWLVTGYTNFLFFLQKYLDNTFQQIFMDTYSHFPK